MDVVAACCECNHEQARGMKVDFRGVSMQF
jgi:hypothetical protein